MGENTKTSDDLAHQTMPPELRPFAKPEPPQRLVAPEDEAEFKAALDALRILNGGPHADPFYVDPKNDPARARGQMPESVKAYTPPTTVPPAVASASEAAVRSAAPAKVMIAEVHEVPAMSVSETVEGIDCRVFAEMRAAQLAAEREANDGEAARSDGSPGNLAQESQASPWATDAPAPEAVRGSALPSSHRPIDRSQSDASTATLITKRPSPKRVAPWIGVAIAIVTIISLRAVTIGSQPSSTKGAVSSAPPITNNLATTGASEPPSTMATGQPVASVEPVATTAPAPSSAVTRSMSKHSVPVEDPYDAAPNTAVTTTVAPVAMPTSTPTVVAPQPSTAPKAPKQIPTTGRILGGEE